MNVYLYIVNNSIPLISVQLRDSLTRVGRCACPHIAYRRDHRFRQVYFPRAGNGLAIISIIARVSGIGWWFAIYTVNPLITSLT